MPETPSPGSEKLADPEWRKLRARRAGQARNSPSYHLSRVTEIVERTRAEQGLPPVVTEDLTIGYVASVFRVIERDAKRQEIEAKLAPALTEETA
jgi:hypothetical protein